MFKGKGVQLDRLKLSKTKLSFEDGTLRKEGVGESLIAEFKEADIVDIRIELVKEYAAPLSICATFLALAIVSKQVIASESWSLVAMVVFLAASGFSLFLITTRKIIIETTGGQVAYNIAEQIEEAQGFVLSVKHALFEKKSETDVLDE